MKTTIEVPQHGRPDKVLRLTLDHENHVVGVTYTGFRTPVVTLDDLAKAVQDLQRRE